MKYGMINEITAATTFIALHLPKTVSEASRTDFREALASKLEQKFVSHWDPKVPLRGNAYRSLSFRCGRLDGVILESALISNVDASLLKTTLPNDFVMWIDPFCVSYRAGEHSGLIVIWEDRDALSTAGFPSDSTAAIADLVNCTPPFPQPKNGDRESREFLGPDDTNSQQDSSPIRQEGQKPSELSDVDRKCASSAPISSAPIVVI